MRIPRFFFELKKEGKEFRLFNKEIIHQVKNVLRKKPGNEIALFDSAGEETLVRILGVERNALLLERLSRKESAKEPARQAVLYCSIFKKENFELAVQKATELGVKEIFPVICARTVKLALKEERLKKIIKEASEQSGRTHLPALQKTLSFEEAAERAVQNEWNLFFDIGAEKFKNSSPYQKIGIFIGPEGGWTEGERALAQKSNFKIVSLCTLSLRAETAAIAAVYTAIWS